MASSCDYIAYHKVSNHSNADSVFCIILAHNTSSCKGNNNMRINCMYQLMCCAFYKHTPPLELKLVAHFLFD